MNGKKLGEILLEEDVLTKRQLQKALDIQNSGDKRKLGEILIELGYITIDDLTDIMMSNGSPHEDRLPVVEPPKVKELSENTKFTLSIQTIVYSFFNKCSAKRDPNKPPTPVINTFILFPSNYINSQ